MNVIVTGSCIGLGCEIYKELKNRGACPIGVDLNEGECVDYVFDISDEGNIESLSMELYSKDIDVIINNAGINYLCPIGDLSSQMFDKVFSTNVKGPVFMVKHFLKKLSDSKGVVVNIVSNASRIPMTHSVAYNGSKGALSIITKQMARELTKRYGIVVFGINPNKLSGTGMSRYIEGRVLELRGWTKEQAESYQKNALLTGKETDPSTVAEFIVWLLSEKKRHEHLSGCLLDVGA